MNGPGEDEQAVDENPGQRMTDEINADPDEAARLRLSRQQARQGMVSNRRAWDSAQADPQITGYARTLERRLELIRDVVSGWRAVNGINYPAGLLGADPRARFDLLTGGLLDLLDGKDEDDGTQEESLASQRKLLGRQVRVTLDLKSGGTATVVHGQLVGFGDQGEFEILETDGQMHYCWPMLRIEATGPAPDR